MLVKRGFIAALESEFSDNTRRTADLVVGLATGLLVILTTTLISSTNIPSWEVSTFRTLNNLPDWIFPVIWPFMQYGVLVTIPIAAAIAAYFKRYRLALMMLTGGLGIYFGARFIKNFVARGRPGDLLLNVNLRENFAHLSKGYTSGHAAVAATIATFAHIYLPKRWQIASIVTLAVVAFGRIYIGGHLPLDIIAGVLMGVSVASLLNYIVGVPRQYAVKTPKPERAKRIRHTGDLLRLAMGGSLFITATAMAFGGSIGTLEEYAFRFTNSMPDFLSPFITIFMQAGSLAFVPIFAIVAVCFKHYRLGTKLLIGGTSAWAISKFAKLLVHRDRPFYLINSILDREQASGILGFPSGHAAVAAALAAVSAPYLSKAWARAVWFIAIVVAISRVYVGAHLPLDVIAGLAMGWVLGSLLNLFFGTPPRTIPRQQIEEALRDAGHPLSSLQTAKVDGRSSTSLYATTKTGKQLFIKLINTENRNADWLFKLYRHLTMREIEDEAPFATAKHQIEHEAYMALAAASSGVRTPKFILAAPVAKHAAIFVTDRINGIELSRHTKPLSNQLLNRVWQQVKLLHLSRIAHRDLRASNIMLESNNNAYIIDFGYSENSPSKRQLTIDVVEMLASLSLQAPVRRVVAQAVSVLGKHLVAKSLPFLQLPALTSVTRKQYRSHPELLSQLRDEVQKQTGRSSPSLLKMTRVNYQSLIWLSAVALAIYILAPRLGELKGVWSHIESLDPMWLIVALLASIASYGAAAIILLGASSRPLVFARTIMLQAATSFVNRITPKSTGGIAITERFLEKSGLKRAEAITAVSLVYASGIVVHLVLLAFSLLRSNVRPSHANEPPILIIILVGISIIGILLIPKYKNALAKIVKTSFSYIRKRLHDPIKVAQLFGGSVAVTLLYVFALYASLESFGSNIGFANVMLVYLAGSVVASAAPTPGGLGATEAALVAGLIAIGTPTDQAVVGVLTFRLFTFWLPIVPGVFAFRHAQKEHLI